MPSSRVADAVAGVMARVHDDDARQLRSVGRLASGPARDFFTMPAPRSEVLGEAARENPMAGGQRGSAYITDEHCASARGEDRLSEQR